MFSEAVLECILLICSVFFSLYQCYILLSYCEAKMLVYWSCNYYLTLFYRFFLLLVGIVGSLGINSNKTKKIKKVSIVKATKTLKNQSNTSLVQFAILMFVAGCISLIKLEYEVNVTSLDIKRDPILGSKYRQCFKKGEVENCIEYGPQSYNASAWPASCFATIRSIECEVNSKNKCTDLPEISHQDILIFDVLMEYFLTFLIAILICFNWNQETFGKLKLESEIRRIFAELA